jgi:hypothetical protein
MTNCSIPNSTPATGRILTTSSRQSKSSSNRRVFYQGNCQLPMMERQRLPSQLRRWALDIGRWMFLLQSAIRKKFTRRGGQPATGRVKGAWWPSRSSKPSSPRKWRGRFDSYPLRYYRFDGRCLRFDSSFADFTSNISGRR